MNGLITPFTNSDLQVPVATELEAITARIKDRLTRQVSDIIETGRDLIEVKSKLDHGQFENWLIQEFSMTDRTARRFMQAATWAEGKSDTVSVLTPTAIYLLSAPSTPESVAQTVFKSVESGEPAKPEAIRDLIIEAKDRDRKAEQLKKEQRARTKEDAGQKQREEQEHLRQRDLNDARGIAEFLCDRLDAEDISTFRRVIANHGVWRAFLEVTSDREVLKPELPSPIKGNKPARRMKSRPARWSDAASNGITALEEMQEMQFEYHDLLDNLPDNLRESEVAEKLEIITGIDFDSAIETVGEANDADLPLGFGRD